MLAWEVSLAACSLNDPTDKLLQFYEYAIKNLWKFCGRGAKLRHIRIEIWISIQRQFHKGKWQEVSRPSRLSKLQA